MWSATKSKTPAENALRHFQDHGGDFGATDVADYVKQAHDFLLNPPPGTLTRIRADGDFVRYNPVTNTFGVLSKVGAPRTFFKPNPAIHGFATNLDYFNAQ
jgi:filamentous hemagglutinin